jgi:prophage regulatory protein
MSEIGESAQGDLIAPGFHAQKRVRSGPGLPAGPPPLVKVVEAAAMLGVSRSTLYNMLRDGDFCQPVRIGPRTVRFLRSEVVAWIQARAAARK